MPPSETRFKGTCDFSVPTEALANVVKELIPEQGRTEPVDIEAVTAQVISRLQPYLDEVEDDITRKVLRRVALQRNADREGVRRVRAEPARPLSPTPTREPLMSPNVRP